MLRLWFDGASELSTVQQQAFYQTFLKYFIRKYNHSFHNGGESSTSRITVFWPTRMKLNRNSCSFQVSCKNVQNQRLWFLTSLRKSWMYSTIFLIVCFWVILLLVFFKPKKVWFLKFRNQFVKYVSRISQAAFCTFVYRRIYQSISSKLTHFSHASNDSLQAFSIYRTEDESSLSKYRRIPNVVNSKSLMLSNECLSIHSFIFLVDFGSFRH